MRPLDIPDSGYSGFFDLRGNVLFFQVVKGLEGPDNLGNNQQACGEGLLSANGVSKKDFSSLCFYWIVVGGIETGGRWLPSEAGRTAPCVIARPDPTH